jgi:ATP-binding cassette subfamily C protein LapB
LAGTLRDNLLAGLFGIKENEIMDACRLTGLDVAIASHPQGLNMEIAEGGIGLSTGQKQLVTLTRMILSKPSIWLLDEPTASMDDASELRCIQALQTSIKQDQTVVIVTHKPALLSLVDRIIIIGATGIIRDGAKNELVRTRTLKPVQESVTMVHNGNKSSVSKVFTNPEKPINDNSSQSSVSGDTA